MQMLNKEQEKQACCDASQEGCSLLVETALSQVAE
jgi:hypothetical protein